MRKLMEKDDLRSLILSVVINIIIILLIPGIKMPQREDNMKLLRVTLNGDLENAKKEEPKKQEEKIVEVLPRESENTVEKVVEEKLINEPKKEVVEKKSEPTEIPLPEILDVDILVSSVPIERKRPIQEKKEVREERVLKESEPTEKVVIEGADLERQELEKIETTPIKSKNESTIISPDVPSDTNGKADFVAMSTKNDKLEGLPKGYKDIGSFDGNISGRWDESNRMPTYPESAELKGETGTVVLQVYVTEEGRVQRIDIKSSGVPELNRAIEEVARTWRIYLSKNGQPVYGDVTIEIPFRLSRGE